MARFRNNGGPYEVHCSGNIAKALHQLLLQAAQQGRAEAFIAALRQMDRRLASAPTRLGEPLYRLPALRMQIRSALIPPLVVHFGVCEDKQLVFIKGVELLAEPK
jgi:hypothetical protein